MAVDKVQKIIAPHFSRRARFCGLKLVVTGRAVSSLQLPQPGRAGAGAGGMKRSARISIIEQSCYTQHITIPRG